MTTSRLRSPLILLAALTIACGGRGRDPDMRGRDSGAGDASPSTGCSDSTYESCVYESRGLAVTNTPRDPDTVLHVHDDLTGRDIPLVAYIPEGDGPFPVVIFSHGGGFTDGHNTSQTWGNELAAHGYVSIHYGSIEPDATAFMAYCDIAEIPPEECTASAVDPEVLMLIGRSRDIIAVMDSLDELSAQSVARGGAALDVERVAIVGWSGGSRSEMPVMGATAIASASVPRFTNPDPRPRAAVFLSPAGPGFGGFFDDGTETSWDELRGPTLIATGDNDLKPDNPDLTGPIRRVPFDAQPGDGARHMLYSNLDVPEWGHGVFNLDELDSSDERIRRQSLAISSTVRAFLDAYVLEDQAAMEYLQSDDAQILAGPSEWLHR